MCAASGAIAGLGRSMYLEVRGGLGPPEGTNQPDEPTKSAAFHLCEVAAATNDIRTSSTTRRTIAFGPF